MLCQLFDLDLELEVFADLKIPRSLHSRNDKSYFESANQKKRGSFFISLGNFFFVPYCTIQLFWEYHVSGVQDKVD